MIQEKKIKQVSGVLFNHVDDELVMMDVERGIYFGINAVGAAIWEKIQNPISIQEVINQLLEEFEVSEEVCIRETLAFLQEVEKHKVIEIFNA